ncbi:MAG TPA: NAD(P)/FAD-dependent oxidoreductase, partial [Tepidisphaeraceae bacterium]|nr:NAD(P)/FAD-dependent oxidoreductase [Tepidisphaeraceae bacterium]
MSEQRKTRILILGGGFGGTYTAVHLDKAIGRDPDVEITLVNRENFFLFTPMLHEVAASDLEITNIVSPIRALVRHTKFFCADVDAVDLQNKRVTVSHGEGRHSHELKYDYMVLALGSTTNFFELPGIEENSVTMKSLGDAIHLRNRIISHLEEADNECAAEDREGLMTFVVAGGGFAGIETIGSVHDLVRNSLRFYPNIDPKLVRAVVVHSGSIVLPELGPELGTYAAKKLTKRGIEIRTNSKVVRADKKSVTLNDGTVIATRTLIWTAGTSSHGLLSKLPCAAEKGRIKVNEFMEVEKWPGVWALGDCALVPDPLTGGHHPPTAQHAIREGKAVARNVTAAIRGGKKRPLRFRTIGLLASIGQRTGVAKIFGFKFSGFFAWWLWRSIYLSKLPRLEKKIRVAIAWTLDVLFPKDLVQFQTELAPTMSDQEATSSVPI